MQPDIISVLSIDKLDETSSIKLLESFDDAYYNQGNPIISDDDYDTIREYIRLKYPVNKYFIGVGSPVRGGKVKLPFTLGSLDQISIGEIQQWISKYGLTFKDLVITAKLDGVSGLIVYDESGNFQISYSRGDGIQGADTSRHVRHFSSVPQKIDTNSSFACRGEFIIPIDIFTQLKTTILNNNGAEYKTPRAMVAGCMNSKEIDSRLYDHIHFIAYDIKGYVSSKQGQLKMLHDLGFNIPNYKVIQGIHISDDYLEKSIKEYKNDTGYEIDGVVIDIDDAEIRQSLKQSTNVDPNPEYAIKYKIVDQDNVKETIVTDVVYQCSKHGYEKPVIEVEPVELFGTTVTYCTGFNAKFIKDNKINKGAKIKITKSGDVIPYIVGVVTPADDWKQPDGNDWSWNDTKVDIIRHDAHLDPTVQQKRMIDFFSSISAPYLKAGNIAKLYTAGYKTVSDIINMRETQLIEILGTNGTKVYSGLRKVLNNIEPYVLIGAFSTERGLGKRKFKKIQQHYSPLSFFVFDFSIDDILDVEGFGVKTAIKALSVMEEFRDFVIDLEESGITFKLTENVSPSNEKLQNIKVIMTGFRDKELSDEIERLGGTISSTISSKVDVVIAKDINGNSSKLKKARNLNIPIMTKEEFIEEYL